MNTDIRQPMQLTLVIRNDRLEGFKKLAEV